MLQTVAVTQGFKEMACEAHHVPQLSSTLNFFSAEDTVATYYFTRNTTQQNRTSEISFSSETFRIFALFRDLACPL